jgi:hypothetical protein
MGVMEYGISLIIERHSTLLAEILMIYTNHLYIIRITVWTSTWLFHLTFLSTLAHRFASRMNVKVNASVIDVRKI